MPQILENNGKFFKAEQVSSPDGRKRTTLVEVSESDIIGNAGDPVRTIEQLKADGKIGRGPTFGDLNAQSITTRVDEGLSGLFGRPITVFDIPGGLGSVIIPNQATGQLAGFSSSQIQGVQSSGGVTRSTDFQDYLADTGQTFSPESGFSGGNPPPQTSEATGGQVSRDAQDNFFLDGRHIEQAEFQQLGINADFVPRGSTVDLGQARTGQASPGSDGTTPGTPQDAPGTPEAGDTTTTSGTGATPSLTGNPDMDAYLAELRGVLTNILASGQTINPAIPLDPSVIAQFQEQAEKEINPNFVSQIRAIKGDLTTNLEFLSEAYKIGREEQESQFKQSLGLSRERRAGFGTIFSGARSREEQESQASQNRALELSALGAESSLRGQVRTAESQVGSGELEGISRPGLRSRTASIEGPGRFDPGRALDFGGEGNIVGSLEKKRGVAVRDFRNILEGEERKRLAKNELTALQARSLNFNQ